MKILLSGKSHRLMIMIKCHWVYKTTIVGEFKIAIDEADGFLSIRKFS
jgi:hypothetical protein